MAWERRDHMEAVTMRLIALTGGGAGMSDLPAAVRIVLAIIALLALIGAVAVFIGTRNPPR